MRRRRPSAAALDGGPPRDPEVHPSMWEMQMADELDGPQDQGDAGPEARTTTGTWRTPASSARPPRNGFHFTS